MLLAISSLSVSATEQLSWKSNGATVNASQLNGTDTTLKTRNKNNNKSINIVLSTGEKVTLTGGIYIETNNPKAFNQWLNTQDLNVTKHKWIDNAYTLSIQPEDIAKQLHALNDLRFITTAEPRYRKTLISK